MSQSNNNQRVKRFYVYAHHTLIDNRLFYIGVGSILNLQTNKHISKYSRAHHTSSRSRYWHNTVNKYGGFRVDILSEFYTKEESLEEEKRLIALYGRKINGGLLCNLSEGGEIGPIGHKKPMSERQKLLLSEIKSEIFYVYNCEGVYIKEIKTIKETAKFCGVAPNAVSSCLNTKNFTNNYFVFREFKGLSIGYTKNDLNFKSTLSKKMFSINIYTNEIKFHLSLMDCVRYIKADRTNLQKAIKNNKVCKGHRIYFERTISSQASSEG